MSDFVLYVGDHGAMVWHARHAPQGVRAAHPDRADDLSGLLRRHPRAGVVVLADDAGQELRLDQLPKLGWFDRRALVRRRLQQAFPPPARAACLAVQKRDTGWAASYGHLPDQGGCRIWLRWLETLPNPRRGALLSSAVAAALIVRSGRIAAPEWEHLFITTFAGLRQVTMRHGMPVLTRLIPCADADGGALGKAALQAQVESQNYLARHGWRPDAPSRLIVIAPAAAGAALCDVLPREATVVSPQQVAAALGLTPDCLDGTRLLASACCALRRRLCVLQHAPAQAAQRTRRLRRLGWATAALIGLGSAAAAVQNLVAWQDARAATQVREVESRHWQHAVAEVRRTLDGNMTLPMRQRQAAMLRAAVLSPAPVPWEMMHVLGRTLPGQIRLGILDWRVGTEGGATTLLTLRLFPAATAKDAAQAESLRLYQDMVTQTAAAMPHAQIKAAQAPYALDAAHPFNDPAMLRLDAAQMPTALLEIREP